MQYNSRPKKKKLLGIGTKSRRTTNLKFQACKTCYNIISITNFYFYFLHLKVKYCPKSNFNVCANQINVPTPTLPALKKVEQNENVDGKSKPSGLHFCFVFWCVILKTQPHAHICTLDIAAYMLTSMNYR